jgi:hypothetical protein
MSRPWIKLTPVLTLILSCGLIAATVSPHQVMAHHSMWHLDDDFDSTNNADDGEGWHLSKAGGAVALSMVGSLSLLAFGAGFNQSVSATRGTLTLEEHRNMIPVAVGNICFGSIEVLTSSLLWASEEEPLYAILLAFGILQLGVGTWGLYEAYHPPSVTSIDKVTLSPMFLPEPGGVTVGATLTIVHF